MVLEQVDGKSKSMLCLNYWLWVKNGEITEYSPFRLCDSVNFEIRNELTSSLTLEQIGEPAESFELTKMLRSGGFMDPDEKLSFRLTKG